MTAATIECRNLGHAWNGQPALDVDTRIDSGRVHLAGPNGAGKTTLLDVLATLVTPTRGTVIVAGHEIREEGPAIRAILGYSGHEPSLHASLPARDALAWHAALHEVPEQRVDRALDDWNLSGHADKRVRALSNGQRRRLDLARTLLHEPPIVLLDEPTTGLDEASLATLRARLDELDPGLLLASAPTDPGIRTQRTLTLDEGQIVEEST